MADAATPPLNHFIWTVVDPDSGVRLTIRSSGVIVGAATASIAAPGESEHYCHRVHLSPAAVESLRAALGCHAA